MTGDALLFFLCNFRLMKIWSVQPAKRSTRRISGRLPTVSIPRERKSVYRSPRAMHCAIAVQRQEESALVRGICASRHAEPPIDGVAVVLRHRSSQPAITNGHLFTFARLFSLHPIVRQL